MPEGNVLPSLNGLFVALGAIVTVMGTVVNTNKKGKSTEYLYSLVPLCLLSGFVGARLFYTVFCDALYLEAAEKWRLLDGGYSVIGCAIGVVLCIAIYSAVKRKKHLFADTLDAAAAPAALGIAVGRMGSVFVEDCLGDFVTDPELMRFPVSIYAYSTGSYRYAVFFYEAAACLLIFVFLYFLGRKLKMRGSQTIAFAVLYSGLRTFTESLRTDSIYLGFIRLSQVIMALLLIAIFVYTAVKLVKLTGFIPVYPVIWIMFGASFWIGFSAMFFMGSDAESANTVKLLVSSVLLTVITLLQYFLLIWLTKEKQRRERQRKKRAARSKRGEAYKTRVMKPVKKRTATQIKNREVKK